MKPFNVYQYLDGTEMTERDKIEAGSKFWNRGKWENFVKPLLPADASGLTFIELGCNAGLFLHFASQYGFTRVIGVDSDREAVERGKKWRDENGETYQFILEKMERLGDCLPLADYTVLVNTHYYFTINDWLDYLDKLVYKTRYCLIVTAEKRHKQVCWASADVADIRGYFSNWEEEGFVDALPVEGDPMPRKLWGLLFRSPYLERVCIDSIRSRNNLQGSFWHQIDQGVPFRETRYYRKLKQYRKRWSEGHLDRWFEERLKVYEDVKVNGVKKPIIIDKDNLILDGNHKWGMLKNMGEQNVIVRKV